MKGHELKTDAGRAILLTPEAKPTRPAEIRLNRPGFAAVWTHQKKMLIVPADRDWRAGDTVRIREWDTLAAAYAGRAILATITHVETEEADAKKAGYAIASIRPVWCGLDETGPEQRTTTNA